MNGNPIGIVDCGLGNVASIDRMLEAVDCDAVIIREPRQIDDCDKLILPGVGAFDAGMKLLEEGSWLDPLHRAAKERAIPILGICLGMQLVCRRSEEGQLPGLGWIDADVLMVDTGGDDRLKLPHMGWSVTRPSRPNPLIPDDGEERRFYFVHKYRVMCDCPDDQIATAVYGTEFTAAVNRGNIYGVQFHPEKSHRFGKELLGSFGRLS
jgi:glutamine amidotransferase